MKTLIKAIIQFPTFYFLWEGIQIYTQNAIATMALTVVFLVVYDAAEYFLGGS